MKVAVLGGGNGSFAAAADLADQGHEISVWRRDADAVAALQEHNNTLLLKDFNGEREVRLARVTADIGDAVAGTALIVCPTPANAQRDIARALAPHLVDDQVVFLPPGSLGSYLMAKTVFEAGNTARVAFAEAGTLPYLTRKHGEFTIAITTRATRLPTGVFPSRLSTPAYDIIRQAYPSVEAAGDALSGALMNAGPIIHPPLILMNAGPIEHFEHWDIHNEGTQPAIRRVTTKLDSERMTTREVLGYGSPHFPLADHYDDEREEWMYGNLAHDKLVDSGDWREQLVLTEHRYMREDVQIGLALLVSVAQWAGVKAPVATGLLALGSAICGEDFGQSGRTLASLGLAQLGVDELQSLFKEGML
ncbi:MAG: NAD/NADP octopine/nopaline dehydrogenase family protein [Gammaproteobacteria bacterium]|nr:NAD/NADP octopine/nopaline dehydrogenase family protein [Gammaproteobacteria bacterium]